MWFTERAHLNDPSEISHGVKIAKEILCNEGRKRLAARLEDTAQRVFRDFLFFSASFSFAYDDRNQWENYADVGRGILLSFKATVFDRPKEFIDRFITNDATAIFCPMSYDSAQLRSVIASMIRCWDGINIEGLSDHIFMISGMFKNDHWNSEREYRFFVHHQQPKIVGSPYYKTRERGGHVIPYLDLPIQNWSSAEGLPICRICVGPAVPPGVSAQLADFLLARNLHPRRGIHRSGIS